MISFEELKRICDKHTCLVLEPDELVSETYIFLAEHDCTPEQAVKAVIHKACAERVADKRMTAPHLYNDDGECIDDDIYFVDDRTVEHNERKSVVTDDQREDAKKMVRILNIYKESQKIHVNCWHKKYVSLKYKKSETVLNYFTKSALTPVGISLNYQIKSLLWKGVK